MKKSLSTLLSITAISTTLLASDIKYDVGIGTNYGGIIGITANKMIQSSIELYGGIGLVGAVAGARYYINENIRFNANYGFQGLLLIENDDDDIEYLHGVNIGLDYLWSNGISLGLMYMATSNKDDVIDDWENKGYDIEEQGLTGDVKLTLGYRF